MNSPSLFPNEKLEKEVNSSRVSRLVTHISREMVVAQEANSPFWYGDLRRTCQTTLAVLGVHKNIRALLHALDLDLQAKHYDTSGYLSQKRDALLVWEVFLSGPLVNAVRPGRRGVTDRQA
jgi:hypothetical protein